MATVEPLLPPIPQAAIVFVGSGDFHHVSLGLVGRRREPCNLLVLDAHPDWMRGVPFLHCGTWLYHAARLPNVATVYHVGGQIDFDNHFRWLAPWSLLQSGKIKVISAARRFHGGRWETTNHQPLRANPDEPVLPSRVEALFGRDRADLAARPLHISIDKDVLCAAEAASNWDCGCLTLAEVTGVIRHFLAAAHGRLVGADIVGDWSPVRVRGPVAMALHHFEHPRVAIASDEATRRNLRANLALLAALLETSTG
ncbi:MAG TPA: arginase family protein [Phycisphaerae bacterium]|nr:arginase family protein [Phycisphaerae bacterium]